MAFHVDRGWSPSMRAALEHWRRVGVLVKFRQLRRAIERVPLVSTR